MNNIAEEIEKRKFYLCKIIVDTKNMLKKMPAGRLRICGEKYYMVTKKGDNSGKYISGSEINLIKDLAQGDYLRAVMRSAQEELDCLAQGLVYTGLCFEEIFDNLHAKRKLLVTPLYLPDELFIKYWRSREYEKPGFSENAPVYYSGGRIKLRSKSEVIIVDKLEYYRMIFLYEFPKVIRGITFHPDFLILKMPERKEIYWEHLGMMDNEDYRNNSIRKLNIYAEGGLVIGDNLIVTMETSAVPLNTEVIDRIIRANLLD